MEGFNLGGENIPAPNKNKKKEMKIMRHLTAAGWNIPKELDMSTNAGINLVRSTVLVGDGTYNDEYFPANEIEKAFLSMDNQPFNLDHSDMIKDEIGYIKNTLYDSESKKMSVQPIINGRLSNSKIAKDFIENRIEAGKVAEVSVGVYVTPVEEELAEGETRIVCRDLEFDHLALVTRGACSPSDGAGIGLKEESNDTDIVKENKIDNTEEKTMVDEEKEVSEEEVIEEPKPEPKPEVKEEEPKEEEKVEESKGNELEELKKEMQEMKKQLAKRKTATYSEEEVKLNRRKAGVDFLKQAATKNMRVSWKGGE